MWVEEGPDTAGGPGLKGWKKLGATTSPWTTSRSPCPWHVDTDSVTHLWTTWRWNPPGDAVSCPWCPDISLRSEPDSSWNGEPSSPRAAAPAEGGSVVNSRTLKFQGHMTLDLSTANSHLRISDNLLSESLGRSKRIILTDQEIVQHTCMPWTPSYLSWLPHLRGVGESWITVRPESLQEIYQQGKKDLLILRP